MLTIKNLRVRVGKKEILRGVTFYVRPGEVHAIMGPNGSGKSTLSYALMGHPQYTVDRASDVSIGSAHILSLPVEERAKAGLFLALQSPIAIPGVSVTNLLRTAYQEMYQIKSDGANNKIQNPLLARRWNTSAMTFTEFFSSLHSFADELGIKEDFLSRGIHDGFSGGEKKKIEMLQALVLSPKFAIFDEIDTGLDVDALRTVAKGIEMLKKKGTGIIIITHYQRILKYLRPDVVHVLIEGRIVKTGTSVLAKEIEENGYRTYEEERHQ